MRNCFYLVLVLLVTIAFLQAQPNQEERLRKLEEICKQQEEQIQKLQGRLGMLQDEESYKKYTENIVKAYLKEPVAEEDEAGITAGYENGFFIRSADRKLDLNITGYMQVGLGIFETTTYDNNSFFINGAYLNFDVSIMEKWRAYLAINFAGTSLEDQFQDGSAYGVAIVDAFLEYKLMPELNFVAGKTLVPFTIAGQYGETQGISIWNEPFINNWAHDRDLGFLVHGTLMDRVEYKAGIFNGEGATTNTNDDFMLAGQLRFYFCKKSTAPNSFFHVGFLRNRTSELTDDSFSLLAPWGRKVFSSPSGADETDAAQGWRTAVDTGARLDMDFANGSNLRLEGEFMYSTWQRKGDTAFGAGGRGSWVDGYGFWLGYAYRHCFDKKVEGSGLINTFTMSYSDVDDDGNTGATILGQTVYTFTPGLGYAFNKHVWLTANWAIMDIHMRKYYGTSKSNGSSGGLEHAFFFQFSAQF